jgi:DNA/RNA-binding domain of Phe-tRNA-synthetase-like protein
MVDMGRWPASEFFLTTDTWRRLFPGAHVGVLAMSGVKNPGSSAALEDLKARVEADLRQRFEGMDRAALKAHPILSAYESHYRRFGKTYHVQLQLESIVLKGKTIPSSAALVESMFMAEVNSLLLTAGHDLDTIRLPLTLDVARGTETYTLLRGSPQTPKAGDMMISDSEGIISTIVYGPDQRTHIRPETTRSVFTVYAPERIELSAVETHLKEIAQYAQQIAPEASVELLNVYSAQ